MGIPLPFIKTDHSLRNAVLSELTTEKVLLFESLINAETIGQHSDEP